MLKRQIILTDKLHDCGNVVVTLQVDDGKGDTVPFGLSIVTPSGRMGNEWLRPQDMRALIALLEAALEVARRG